jgi:Tol biopolymer transport system component
MSFKHPFALVCAAALLAAGGCSSGQAADASSSTVSGRPVVVTAPGGEVTSAQQGAAPQLGGPMASTTSTAPLIAPVNIDPEAWKSEVIAKVSMPLGGGEADGRSEGCSISADGRYVVFDSQADNLVPGDTNLVTRPGPDTGDPNWTEPPITYNATDVFVFDRQTGSLERVSVAGDGTQGDNSSGGGGISADGRYVVFVSEADNLVAGDTNKAPDAFVHDRQTGATERVSLAGDGSQGNGASYPRGISPDGRYVLFVSDADNLVPRDTNGVQDVFLRDRQAGTTERVSVGSGGEQADQDSYGCAMTPDARFVVFDSRATDLIPGDTNKASDIFARDRLKGITERVSLSKSGAQGNQSSYGGSISADGRYVCFDSDASNLVPGDTSSLRRDVFVYDRQTRTIKRVSVSPAGKEGANSSGSSYLSADGRYVVFRSYASNLVPGDTSRKDDIFVRDLKTGTTRRVSLSAEGEQQNTEGTGGTISADGRWVVFVSRAGNLVPGDTNEMEDVFVTKADR